MDTLKEIWLVLNIPIWKVAVFLVAIFLCVIVANIVFLLIRFVFHFILNGFSIKQAARAMEEADGWGSVR